MKPIPTTLRAWSQDTLLRRVLRNSSYLISSNVIGAGLTAVMSIAAANLLGVAQFGVLGVVTSLVSNVNRLLSFRMNEVVVKHMGEYLARDEQQRAAALVKAAGLLEAGTSLVAYLLLALLAPLAAGWFAKDVSVAPLIILYGLTIPGNLVTETATGVLQVGNHYRSQATINLAQNVLVVALIAAAALAHAGLLEVLLIYLLGKLILGLGPIFAALYWLPRMLGRGWWHAPFSLLPPFRELGLFAINTNFSGTINVLARDSESLWVSYFFSPVEAGYFKLALSLINPIVMPLTPFISTTFPEIARTVTLGQWARLRSLLKRVTALAAAWSAAMGVGLLVLGKPLLFTNYVLFGRVVHIYRPEYFPAFPALMILLVGYGIASVFFWNRTLLLALGDSVSPLTIGAAAAAGKVLLTILLVPRFGYLMEAALLSLYFLVSVGSTVLLGLRRVRQLESQPQGA